MTRSSSAPPCSRRRSRRREPSWQTPSWLGRGSTQSSCVRTTVTSTGPNVTGLSGLGRLQMALASPVPVMATRGRLTNPCVVSIVSGADQAPPAGRVAASITVALAVAPTQTVTTSPRRLPATSGRVAKPIRGADDLRRRPPGTPGAGHCLNPRDPSPPNPARSRAPHRDGVPPSINRDLRITRLPIPRPGERHRQRPPLASRAGGRLDRIGGRQARSAPSSFWSRPASRRTQRS